ncbi:phosphoribosylaminoimidazolesuccinocarboxamide synthase [Candidatus Daviesbacteria bacterium]|nr:phosphoribosylaminoimidazolesuccinocarboxamide synthase [Candidatus Daviesbacteria bacterium]
MVTSKKILQSIPLSLQSVDIPSLGKKSSGKVRDYYILNDKRVIITTDRQSAFDVILGCIPFKGAVLNLLSAFWFEKTKDIVPNHIISIPDPNVTISKEAELIPIEMVIRGYISGVTNTSIWGSYEKGERIIYGIKFPDGLRKNQKLPEPVITPTTKALKGHDERLTEKEILQKKIVSPKIWKQMKEATLALFERGIKICAKAGIILVDTKYEFGLLDGKLILIDELHTPDGSRFWIKKTYKGRFEKRQEPENFDKEFLRLWYAKKGYKGDGEPPKMSKQLIVDLSQRYISIYEKITGKKFPSVKYPMGERIKDNLGKVLLKDSKLV